MAQNPYENVNAYNKNLNAQPLPDGNSRDTDARALLTCAYRLEEARGLLQTDPKSRDYLRQMAEAVRQNQRLWTIFQVAVADPQSPLPQNLRSTLFNLSRYVDKTSFRCIGKFNPELMESLINVNRILAAGLSKPVSETAQTMSPPPDRRDIPVSLFTSA